MSARLRNSRKAGKKGKKPRKENFPSRGSEKVYQRKCVLDKKGRSNDALRCEKELSGQEKKKEAKEDCREEDSRLEREES